MSIWNKLAEVEERYNELSRKLSSSEVINDRQLFRQASIEHSSLQEVVGTYRAYKKAKEEIASSQELVSQEKDVALSDLARDEIRLLEKELEALEARLKLLLLPRDPNDNKNVILEIRAGTGGDEAAIFGGDLFRMLSKYCERYNFQVEILSASYASSGGLKEIIAMITGQGAYSRLKYERGVHRVQRVPATEAQGRVHTSTVTVAVLPEAEDVDLQIEDKDLRIDVYRAGGHGGQSVNTTDSAVRITHLPSGLVVAIQDEKSQHKNRDKAMKVLRSRLLEQKIEEQETQRRDDRRSQVGSGERAEKIRTYNYPQSRITDHRIGLTLYDLSAVLEGDLDQVIEPLIAHYQTEALRSSVGD